MKANVFSWLFKISMTPKWNIKFIYSEKATKFWEISTLLLSYVVPVKSKLEILQSFMVFLEYMNFNIHGFSKSILIFWAIVINQTN